MGSESAPHFNNSLAITYTVFIDGNGAGTYTPNLVTIPNWDGAGTWGYNAGGTLEVKYENFRYSLVTRSSTSSMKVLVVQLVPFDFH